MSLCFSWWQRGFIANVQKGSAFGSALVQPPRPGASNSPFPSPEQIKQKMSKTSQINVIFCDAHLGRCPSTVRPVFPMLVFQRSKQQNRTRTTSSSVLGTPPNRTRTKHSSKRSFEAVALLVGLSIENPPKIGIFTAWNCTRNRLAIWKTSPYGNQFDFELH